MLMTKRKPATIGEILVKDFMKPIGLTQRLPWLRPWVCSASTLMNCATIATE